MFYTPARITGGGATGVGTIFYYLFGFDQGTVMMFINIPLVLFGMKVFGWKYGIRTLVGSVMLSLWTTLIGHATGYQGLLNYSDTVNVLLSALFGGVLMGVGDTAGFLAARRIREQDRGCRLVIVDDTPRYAIHCLRIHAADFLLRPVEEEQLQRSFRRLVGRE